jgi:hypothetical protein
MLIQPTGLQAMSCEIPAGQVSFWIFLWKKQQCDCEESLQVAALQVLEAFGSWELLKSLRHL